MSYYFASFDKNGELHSFNNKPAQIYGGIVANWYKYGFPHRDNHIKSFIILQNWTPEFDPNRYVAV